MTFVVKECSEFPSMGETYETTNAYEAVKQFILFRKRAATLIPSIGIKIDEDMSCDFYAGGHPDLDMIQYCFSGKEEIDKAFDTAEQVIKIIEDSKEA